MAVCRRRRLSIVIERRQLRSRLNMTPALHGTSNVTIRCGSESLILRERRRYNTLRLKRVCENIVRFRDFRNMDMVVLCGRVQNIQRYNIVDMFSVMRPVY